MIGALAASGELPFDEETVKTVLRERLRPRYYDINVRAFELGKEAYRKASH
jgi:Pyruvate/2-oxoacid:ferredoxin oxidoreductase gamma subunit